MAQKEKKVVAYEVYDGNDGWSIQFATNGASARRQGASEIGCEWEDIDHCRRKPELDQYAPGPIPIKAMLDAGWWFECSCCGKQCYGDHPGLVIEDPAIYCSDQCSQAEWRKEKARAAAYSNLVEVFETKFPGATILNVYISGDKLETKDKYGGCRSMVTFKFPGGESTGNYHYGDDFATVRMEDVGAFQSWQDGRKAA